jgi:hypothetical protein
MFEIWAALSGVAGIQSMIRRIQFRSDGIQCAIPSNADEAIPVQDRRTGDQNALGPILLAIPGFQDATNLIQ